MTNPESTKVIENLRREQANATRLYLQYKGYHWNVSGPLFQQLHELFDSHAKTVLDTVDELAERQRMLGGIANYTLEQLRSTQTLPSEDGVPESDQEMIERLREAHLVVIDGLKAGFRASEESDDPGSADLFARTVQLHEKMEWFLREHLVGRGLPASETMVRSAHPSETGSTVP